MHLAHGAARVHHVHGHHIEAAFGLEEVGDAVFDGEQLIVGEGLRPMQRCQPGRQGRDLLGGDRLLGYWVL